MIAPFLAAVLMGQVEAAPVRRATLPGGAQVVVSNLSSARHASAVLVANSAGLGDTPEDHGLRHLMEHLMVRGLDNQLESAGCLLKAETTRDAVIVEVTGPADQVERMVDALGAVLRPPSLSDEDVAREVGILRQEFALKPDAQRAASAAWVAAFGLDGLDPYGDPAVVAQADARSIQDLHAAQFSAPRLALSIAGPIDVGGAMDLARRTLAYAPEAVRPSPSTRRAGEPKRARAEAVGAARAVPVPGIAEPATLATLAAGFGLREATPASELIYTPSALPGLVTWWAPVEPPDPERWSEWQQARVAELGRRALRTWLRLQLESPAAAARLRGVLAVQRPGYDPERLLGEAEALTRTATVEAMKAFAPARAFVVEGTR